MYTGLRILKSPEDAAEYAKSQGYSIDKSNSFRASDRVTRCKCGETEVRIFGRISGNIRPELAVGICSSCGEE
jgi:hypothetical protein